MSNALTLFNDSPIENQIRKAEILVKSGMVPAAYKSPEAVLAACTIGSELGFSPMQSLQVINVIDGKPTLGLNGYLALVTAHGGHVETLEQTDTVCKLRIHRAGRTPHEEIYTMADAAKAGLAGKTNWVKMPKKMLFARAASAGIRIVFADVVSGLYSTEEMQDVSDEAPKAAPARPKKPDAPAVVVEAEVVTKAPAAITAFIDVPVEPEPPLPGQDVHAEAFDAANPAHVTVLADSYASVMGVVADEDRVSKLTSWAAKKGLKVGELGLEMKRLRKE